LAVSEQLDRVRVGDPAADALEGVEQHVRLAGERVADEAQAQTIDDDIARAPIAESHGICAGGNGGHVLIELDGPAEHARRRACGHAVSPDVIAIRILQLVDRVGGR
jgi:hypothetical protein